MKYFILITLLAVASPAFAYSSSYEPDGFTMFSYFLSFVLTILNIILFFKLWGMTNNVKRIKEKIVANSSDDLTEELNTLHFMGKDKECEDIILREFYSTLCDKLDWAKGNMLEDHYSEKIDEPITKFTDVVAKQYKKIGREIPDMIKNMKTYRDFLNQRIEKEDTVYPQFQD